MNLSTTKAVSAVFHLNDKEVKGELKCNFNAETLPFCSEPKYLGVTMDNTLTYRRHLESLRKKLTLSVALLRLFVGSGWGAGLTTLRTATLALVNPTAEYCALLPGATVLTPASLIHAVINDALRTVTGCLRPEPADNFSILTGIQPAELLRKGATLSLARRAMEPGHLLEHSADTGSPGGKARHLQSMHPSPHSNSSVHLMTTTEVRRSGPITDGMRRG